jgi:hypothetical protein
MLKKKILIGCLAGLSSLTVNAATMTGTAQVHANQGLGWRGQAVYLSCQHHASATNTSGSTQYVYVHYTICATNKDCFDRRFKIKVGNGTWQDGFVMTYSPIYYNAGVYEVTCKTEVEGLAQAIHTNTIRING